MPKNDIKRKQTRLIAAAVQTHDDFVDMLAEFQTADLNAPSTAITATSTSTSSVITPATVMDYDVSEQALIAVAIRGDISQLQRSAKQGFRVRSGYPLVHVAANGKADAARCLVKDLRADINKAGTQGFTPLTIATQHKDMEMMKCLVKELGADVNLADTQGNTRLSDHCDSAERPGIFEVPGQGARCRRQSCRHKSFCASFPCYTGQ
jgi:hypothetical protein